MAAVRHMTRRWSDRTSCCCGWPGARSVDAAARWRSPVPSSTTWPTRPSLTHWSGSPSRSPGFRGESRFTTWACKFAIFEVSTKSGRLFWKKPTVPMDAEDWDRLPDRFGLDPGVVDPGVVAKLRDVVAALHRAVDDELTDHQRRIFVAIVLSGPLCFLLAQAAHLPGSMTYLLDR